MICKDISFIEKVLSEQELLKSKCENKLYSLREYKGQLLKVGYTKGHPYYSAYFPGEAKHYLGKETHPDVLGIREHRLYETLLTLAEGNIGFFTFFSGILIKEQTCTVQQQLDYEPRRACN